MRFLQKSFFLPAGLLAVPAYAQDNPPTRIPVEMTDGSTLSLLFVNEPVIKYADNTIVFGDKTTSVTVDAADVLRYVPVYVDLGGINDVSVADLGIRVDGSDISVSLARDTQVSVYTLAGRQVYGKLLPAGEHTVADAALPAGTYIVTVGGKTVKVQKL